MSSSGRFCVILHTHTTRPLTTLYRGFLAQNADQRVKQHQEELLEKELELFLDQGEGALDMAVIAGIENYRGNSTGGTWF